MSPIGCFCGGFTAKFFMERGRLLTIYVCLGLLILGSAICVYESLSVILVGRFIAGLSAGIGFIVVPKYIYEISPPSMRG